MRQWRTKQEQRQFYKIEIREAYPLGPAFGGVRLCSLAPKPHVSRFGVVSKSRVVPWLLKLVRQSPAFPRSDPRQALSSGLVGGRGVLPHDPQAEWEADSEKVTARCGGHGGRHWRSYFVLACDGIRKKALGGLVLAFWLTEVKQAICKRRKPK
jgi:hypothetical protein